MRNHIINANPGRTMKRLQVGTILLGLSPLTLMACGEQMVGWPVNEIPKIESTDPAHGQTDVRFGTMISAVFSEPMDSGSIDESSFTVRDGDTLIPGVVTYAGLEATFDPTGLLDPDVTYSATFDASVQDASGVNIDDEYTWLFATGIVRDITHPTVLSTIPVDDATTVSLDTNVSVTFSEIMHPLTVTTDTFTLRDAAGPITGDITQVGSSAFFDPDVDLTLDTEYTATITRDAQDIWGNGLEAPYVWTFTTGTALPFGTPSVVLTEPANLAIDVLTNTEVSATFSEAMHPLTITDASFLLQAGSQMIEGEVTQIGLTAFFDPDVELDADTEYTATITDQAQDFEGNAIAEDYVWTFTTGSETEAPMVSFTNPVDLAIDVLKGTDVTATFSEEMDDLTITDLTFLVNDPDMLPVDGIVTYDDLSMTATFDPDIDLMEETEYTATITVGAMDLAGNPIEEDYVWTFTTGIVFPGQPRVDMLSLETFVAVAGAGLTNSNSSGVTILNGDVGLYPTFTCLGDGTQCSALNPSVNGTLYLGGTIAAQAKTDLTAVLIDAMGRLPLTATTAEFADTTVTRGVYKSGSSMLINGTVTLDGEGDPNSVFIFQVSTALTVADGAQIVLINGAQAKYVYWAVGSSSTIGANVSFQGSVLAQASNSVGTDSVVIGRMLCTDGQITLLSNMISLPLP